MVPSSEKFRRRRWSWWKILLALAFAAAAAYALFERPWQPKPVSVAVEVVAAGSFQQVLAVNGRVAAREAVIVRAAVSAPAVDVLTSEGDVVQAGDLIARLDTAQPTALVAQAQAALDAGIVSRTQAQANADRANALGENAPRTAREDAQLALSAANNEVARLQAALEQAQSQLAQYTIVAPLDGVVLDRKLERGMLVDPQTELFEIANTDELLVETDVDELYSSRIKTGLAALLKPVGDSVPKSGSVVFAAPTVDAATGGRSVKIAFDEAVDLPVGLTVNANIIVSETATALTVPRGAIVTEGTQSHMLVLEGETAVRRDVEFSDWPADRVIITQGLSEDDVVILEPSAVAAGQTVVAK